MTYLMESYRKSLEEMDDIELLHESFERMGPDDLIVIEVKLLNLISQGKLKQIEGEDLKSNEYYDGQPCMVFYSDETKKYYELAGLVERANGTWGEVSPEEAEKTIDYLKKEREMPGYHLAQYDRSHEDDSDF